MTAKPTGSTPTRLDAMLHNTTAAEVLYSEVVQMAKAKVTKHL